MAKKVKKTGADSAKETDDKKFPLPKYPAKEDIYNKDEEELFDENAIGQKKKGATADSDNDLDVPGAELDNEDEVIGEEDEENNYYSLGGDNHDDLEEDKG
jgi:hypothetical protein